MTQTIIPTYSHHLDPNMKWMARPTEKCDGKYYVKKVELLVNWFKFTKNIYDREYYEYEVKMYKQKEFKNRKGQMETKVTNIPIPERSELFWKHMRYEAEGNPFNIEEYVFDEKDTVYSINQHLKPLTSRMVHPEKKNIAYVMQLSLREGFRLNFSREDPTREDIANRSYKFLKVVMTQKVRYVPDVADEAEIKFAKNFVYDENSILRVPESFYDRDRFDHTLEIAPRIESWFGIYIAVKELYDGNPVLNFAIVEKLFYNAPKMSLLDYLLLIIDPETRHDNARRDRKRQLKEGNLTINRVSAKKINQYLEKLKLKCSEVWDNKMCKLVERHLTFLELSRFNSFEQTVTVRKGRGRDSREHQVPIFEIYEGNKKYIDFPQLPLVKVKSGANEYSVPIEHLEVHESAQRYKSRIDFVMQHKFIQAATRKPHVYKTQAIQMLKDLDFSSEKLNFVEKFDLSSDLKMITCPGKVLKEPNLVNRENKTIEMTPVIRGFKEKHLNVVPEKELCCAVFILRADEDRKPCLEEEDVYKFYKALIDGCEFRSLRIGKHEHKSARSILHNPDGNRYGFYPDVTLHNGACCFQAAANDAKTLFEKLPDKEDKVLLFIVISDPQLNAYGFIKQHCDVSLGVASQYIRVQTAKRALDELADGKPSKKIFYNIALKINGKLGGVNQELDFSVNAEMSPEEKEQRKSKPLTMYVGIDVTHPTNGSGIDYSIAAIVASINPGGTKYRNMIVTQEECRPGERPVAHGRERTDILEGKFVKLLRLFAENNNDRIPGHIIVYRDGVSDSEMLRVSHDELRSLKREVEQFLAERCKSETVPKYTFIVIQKRHKTRLFRKIDQERPKDKEEAKQWDEDKKESDNTGFVNPSSGTTVDKVIVSKYKFDFFLASHHGALGTSRPGYYTVMYDDTNLTKDEAYKMTYELAFLSARCRKPISLPAPVHYAHLSCEKAKELYKYFKQFLKDELPYNLSRREVEEYLQTNRKYPGMSFT